MIPSNIEKEHIIKAIREIDSNGIPSGRQSRKFYITFKGKQYSPKYVLSLANKFANGEELDPSRFNGGQETNNFLKRLEFDIVDISSSRAISAAISSQNKTINETQKGHDERCPDCKKTVERMLKKIYGNVEGNYKFEVSTDIEDYKDFLFYQKLKEIFLELQKYRRYEDFVKTMNLPRCDFFVRNPGFIVEFDESQHFTIPRKISLQNYPHNLELSFSSAKWIALCDKHDSKDNDPHDRDEQRAWYDTLRDFLPKIKGLKPTVRLYSNEMQWCSLNPDDPNDVARFRNIIDRRRKDLNGWVATVIIQSNHNKHHSNDDRMNALSEIVNHIAKKTSGDGVILFPGGWFYTGEKNPNTIYVRRKKEIKAILEEIEDHIIVCAGIDGTVDEEEYSHDQIAIAVSKGGIDAMGRKFHPAPKEIGHVELAKDCLSGEDGKSRIFELNGIKYFMCVCYDTYGIRHKNLPNPNVDVVLNFVHCFYPRGVGPSGDTYFARHGFAGAAKQWDCPVFGTAVFFNRNIPERWPSGVVWDQGDKSTKEWLYENNPIKSQNEFEVNIKEGIALVRIYDLEVI